jgi:predicted Zn-dependent protease
MSRGPGAVSNRARSLGFALTFLWCGLGGLACTAHHRTPVWQGEIPKTTALSPEAEDHAAQVLVELQDDHAVLTEGAIYDQVWPVFAGLLAAAELEPADWRIYVLDTPEIADVRAVHGQRLFLWSGTMGLLESEDELAGLMASEIAHVLAQHAAPVAFHPATEVLFSLADVATTLGLAVLSQGMLAVSMPGMTRHAYIEAADLDPLDRRYTLEQESETVFVALAILENSDYCPAALKRLWERVDRQPEVRARSERLLRGIPAAERLAILDQELAARGLSPKTPADPGADTAAAGAP